MAWGMVAGAVIGGVVSYAGQKSSNAANAKAAKQQGYVDTTTTRKGDPYADPYRQGSVDAAWNALTGQNPLSGNAAAPVLGEPGAGGGAGGGRARNNKGPSTWTNAKGQTMTLDSRGRAVAGTPGAGGAGGGAGTAGGSGLPSTIANKGQSAATSSIIGRLEQLPGQNAAMNGVSEKYTTDLLQGRSSNPLLDPATAAANDVGDDPRLAAFQDYLMGSLGIGAGGGGGGAAGGGYSGTYSGSYGGGGGGRGGGGDYGYGASATGTDVALRDLVAGKDPAGWAAMQKAIEDSVNASRAESLRNLKGNAVKGGFYGGSGFDSMEAQAEAAGDQQLAGQLAQARFGAFQNALGLGTQYDLGMADVAAKDRATAAGSASSAASLAAAQRAQDLGALGDSLSLGEQSRYGRSQQLGNLAGLFSDDQRAALGGINDLAASRRGDLSAAGQLALGSDQTQNSLRAAQMDSGNARAALAWQKQQFYDPLSRLGAFNDILNGAYGAYGSETTTGRDTRAGGGAAGVSPFSAALGGAAIGGQLGSLYNNRKTSTGGG